ncbi:oligosaccharide biosynthesis protein Alg14 [Sphingomonas bacterium]|uniref:oligosaccharide biosynthesis protein Alg14 n=1 Tax=Sphingomonas bacterium TaxID=1895847 RepID=UPI001575D668|nr:oligosaccharide biosynthesis protein Alg14 [Sphingomonas bacterium]
MFGLARSRHAPDDRHRGPRRPGRWRPSSRPDHDRPLRRIVAAASGGGHWVELLRLRPAFEGLDVVYVSTIADNATVVPDHRFYSVPDASRFRVKTFAPIMVRAMAILARERPFAVVTTGSAPMLPFVLLARLFGARTLWIDSVACTEHLSTSGRIARRIAHRCIVQSPKVAGKEGLEFWGSVI